MVRDVQVKWPLKRTTASAVSALPMKHVLEVWVAGSQSQRVRSKRCETLLIVLCCHIYDLLRHSGALIKWLRHVHILMSTLYTLYCMLMFVQVHILITCCSCIMFR